MDLTGYDLDALEDLRIEVQTAIERLQTVESAPESLEQAAQNAMLAGVTPAAIRAAIESGLTRPTPRNSDTEGTP